MNTRQLLLKSDIVEYRQFCERDGWAAVLPIGPDEVLRMKHPRRDPLVVRDMPNFKKHYITTQESSRMFLEWQKTKEAEPGA